MIYRAKLKPRMEGDPGIDFTWDSETDEITGPDADLVKEYIENAREHGYVNIAPVISYPLPEGRFSPEDMGAIFMAFWRTEDVFPQSEHPRNEVPDGWAS